MKRLVFLLVCFLLLVSAACAQTVNDYSFAQDRIREMEEKYGVRILVGPEATVLYTDYAVTVGEAAYELPLFQRMDMLRFLRLRAWDAQREQEKKKPRQRFIDEVWPGVKPG